MFANISLDNALKYVANKDATTLHIMLNNIVHKIVLHDIHLVMMS
jgi:hypothetical protein